MKNRWEMTREEERENAKRQLDLWERKYRIARAKGKDAEAEEAQKHIEYWEREV